MPEAEPLAVAARELLGERRDVVLAIAQRRHDELDDREPVVEILAERAGLRRRPRGRGWSTRRRARRPSRCGPSRPAGSRPPAARAGASPAWRAAARRPRRGSACRCSACAKKPGRAGGRAGERAACTWPNSSASASSAGSAAQLNRTSGLLARVDCAWSSSATNSLPVPVSPRTSTVTSRARDRGSWPRAGAASAATRR